MPDARDDITRRLDAALDDLCSAEYRRGREDGLAVAEKIRAWLTREPDTRRQRETREWFETEIKKARGGDDA